MSTDWTPWHEVVEIRGDLKTNQLSLDEFAADLHDVVTGNANRQIYVDDEEFFRLTYPTESLRDLVEEVALRLAGQNTKSVRQLMQTYGGGKTHALITLYHLFRDPPNLPDVPAVREFRSHLSLDDFPSAHVAAIPFDYFDVEKGRKVYDPNGNGRKLVQPWSVIAYALAGNEGLRVLHPDAEADERSTAPSTDTIESVFRLVEEEGHGILLLLDEVMMHAENLVSGDREKEDPLVNFYQCLVQAAGRVDRCCIIASILSSDRSTYDDFGKRLEQRVANVFRRKEDESIKPVGREDIAEILRRRFFTLESVRNVSFREHVIAALRGIRAFDEVNSEEEERYRRSYPFHPDLTDVFYQKWTNLESFQEARGVLRTLASAVRDARMWDDSPLVSTNVFLSEPGSDELSDAAEQLVDIAAKEEYEGSRQSWSTVMTGELERAREIQSEFEGLENREIEQFTFGIFLHSQPKGRTAPTTHLLRLVGSSSPDKIQMEEAMQRLIGTSWFLDEKHFPDSSGEVPETWRLGDEPNLTQMKDKALGEIGSEVDDPLVSKIRSTDSLFNGARSMGAEVHKLPRAPSKITDDTKLHYAVLGPKAASRAGEPSEEAVRYLRETTGPDRPRAHPNTVVLAVPSVSGLQAARNQLRDHLAWERVADELSDQDTNPHQRQRLSEMRNEAKEKVEHAVKQAYSVVVTVGKDGEPEAIQVEPSSQSLFQSIKNTEAVRIKDSALNPGAILPGAPYSPWQEGEDRRPVRYLLDAYASRPSLPKILRPDALKNTIIEACQRGLIVLHDTRSDESNRTYWRSRPEDRIIEEEESNLEAVLPGSASLTTISASLLAPGELPDLWEETESGRYNPITVRELYEYFSGDTDVSVDHMPTPVPEAEQSVVNRAISRAVNGGRIWYRHGQTSLFQEQVPAGDIASNAELDAPPPKVNGTDLLPSVLEEAWTDGMTTAGELADALSESREYVVPWARVKEGISTAIQLDYMRPTPDSASWPTERAGADQVRLRILEEPTASDSPETREAKPDEKRRLRSTSEAKLNPEELQDLVDEVSDLLSAAEKNELSFLVRIELNGGEDAITDETRDAVNEILQHINPDLEI